MGNMDNTEFNNVVTSKGHILDAAARVRDPAEAKAIVDGVKADLVARFGAEQAFLLFHAARLYVTLPEPPPPSGGDPEALP
jgi:hypothetical protein